MNEPTQRPPSEEYDVVNDTLIGGVSSIREGLEAADLYMRKDNGSYYVHCYQMEGPDQEFVDLSEKKALMLASLRNIPGFDRGELTRNEIDTLFSEPAKTPPHETPKRKAGMVQAVREYANGELSWFERRIVGTGVTVFVAVAAYYLADAREDIEALQINSHKTDLVVSKFEGVTNDMKEATQGLATAVGKIEAIDSRLARLEDKMAHVEIALREAQTKSNK